MLVVKVRWGKTLVVTELNLFKERLHGSPGFTRDLSISRNIIQILERASAIRLEIFRAGTREYLRRSAIPKASLISSDNFATPYLEDYTLLRLKRNKSLIR